MNSHILQMEEERKNINVFVQGHIIILETDLKCCAQRDSTEFHIQT